MRALSILLFLALVSCTVQKRQYRKGYFVQWNKHSTTVRETEKSTPEPEKLVRKMSFTPSLQEIQVLAGTDETKHTFVAQKKNIVPPPDSCDVILFKDGSEVSAKIVEVNITQVRYKKCEMPDGPIYTVFKAELFMLKYANGTREVIKVQETPMQRAQQNAYRQDVPVKKNTALATKSLVFGILGFYPLIFVGGVIAIISAVIQLNRISLNPERFGGEKRARAGLILGIASILLWAFIIGSLLMI